MQETDNIIEKLLMYKDNIIEVDEISNMLVLESVNDIESVIDKLRVSDKKYNFNDLLIRTLLLKSISENRYDIFKHFIVKSLKDSDSDFNINILLDKMVQLKPFPRKHINFILGKGVKPTSRVVNRIWPAAANWTECPTYSVLIKYFNYIDTTDTRIQRAGGLKFRDMSYEYEIPKDHVINKLDVNNPKSAKFRETFLDYHYQEFMFYVDGKIRKLRHAYGQDKPLKYIVADSDVMVKEQDDAELILLRFLRYNLNKNFQINKYIIDQLPFRYNTTIKPKRNDSLSIHLLYWSDVLQYMIDNNKIELMVKLKLIDYFIPYFAKKYFK